jgi:hypothetical protein
MRSDPSRPARRQLCVAALAADHHWRALRPVSASPVRKKTESFLEADFTFSINPN